MTVRLATPRRPGGRLVFFEHFAAERGTWSRHAQRFVAPASRLFDHGCDPSRESWRAIERAGFAAVDLRWFASAGPLRTRIPYIAGCADSRR